MKKSGFSCWLSAAANVTWPGLLLLNVLLNHRMLHSLQNALKCSAKIMTSRTPDMEHSVQCQLMGLLRYTKGEKKTISSNMRVCPLHLSDTKKISPLLSFGEWGARGYSKNHRDEEEMPDPALPSPTPTVNSNWTGWNSHPLVQTHLKVPRLCCLIDSACVEGLGVVYAACQDSAGTLSIRTQLAGVRGEWCGDRRG